MEWILIIAIVSLPFVVAQESGWGTRGEYHYYFSPSTINNHGTARTRCHGYGAELTSIASEVEQNYISGRMAGTGYWIGLDNVNPCDHCKNIPEDSTPTQECVNCRNRWRWLDNASHQYQNWEYNKPGNNAECGRLFHTGQWRSESCGSRHYRYICKTEDLCERNPDPCTHGLCDIVYTHERYTCSCEAGYAGKNCSQDINECAPMPCLNGGSCEDRTAEYICTCPVTWTGDNCEMDVDECLNGNICSGNGECDNKLGSFECQCHDGFTGVHCETDINECLNQTLCKNSATCRNEPRGSFTCDCKEGWEGADCARDINECENPSMCRHGNCTNREGGYDCRCGEGYSGARCDVSGDEDDASATLWVVFYASLVCMCLTGLTCAVMLVIDIKETRFDMKKHNEETTKHEFDELVPANEAIPSTSRDVSRGVYINEQEINSMYRQRVRERNMSMTE